MPRVMTIWLPRWPVQRRLLERPEWRKRPVFVCRREARGLLTVVSWAWAEPPKRERTTIQPGMSLAEAMSVLALAYGPKACHIAETETDDPTADMAALEHLARACRRFAPTVGIEAVPLATGRKTAGMVTTPECLYLDVTNTANFFGGEASLARTAAWNLVARGLHARTAIADTPVAAWAAAHHTDLVTKINGKSNGKSNGGFRTQKARSVVVPSGWQRLSRGDEAILANLPLTALRLEPAAIDMFREVGIDTIGGLLRLPSKSLASRFPASVSLRLAEFIGTRPEPIVPPRGEQLPTESHDFELPLSLATVSEEAICHLLEQLISRCTTTLASRGEGIVSLQARLEPAVTATTTAKTTPAVIEVSVFRPSSSPRHLVDLVRLRMGRTRLPREIEAITVEVIAAGPATCRQRSLFAKDSSERSASTAESNVIEVGLLLDRLAGRLGRPAVLEPRLVADAQPEHAWLAAPPAAAPSRNRMNRFQGAGSRPTWMPPRPIPLEDCDHCPWEKPSMAFSHSADPWKSQGFPCSAPVASCDESLLSLPAGLPTKFRLGDVIHRVRKTYGPERIETAWWRGPTVRRDYYVVETESGERFWLFQRLGRRPSGGRESGWYLHGVFA